MQKERYERYGDYILDRSEQLGKGSYGTVYRGYHLDNEQRLAAIAIKEAYLHEQIMKEIRTLETLSHRNIVRYIDYREYKGYVLMFMELCEGTLDGLLLKNPTVEERLNYFRQIVAGVRFMYSRSLLHRDLKPSNVLVRGTVIKIADFGTAKFVAMDQLHHETLAGTPLFCSPEILQVRLGQNDRYTEQSEIWSLGLLLYYIFNFAAEAPPEERTRLSLPWHSRGEGKLLEMIRNEPLVFRKETPKDVEDVLRKMLMVDPQQRLGFAELFSMELFRQKEEESPVEDKKKQTTIQLTLINKGHIDDKLKDRLREIEAHEQQELQHSAVQREKAIFVCDVHKKLMAGGSLLQLCELLARTARNLLLEYLTLGMTALTCSAYRDSELMKQLEAKHPAIKQPIQCVEEQLHNHIIDYLKDRRSLVEDLHDQSKLTSELRSQLWLMYDLLIVDTLQQHWAEQRPRKIDSYYEQRLHVRDCTLIRRLQAGIKAVLG